MVPHVRALPGGAAAPPERSVSFPLAVPAQGCPAAWAPHVPAVVSAPWTGRSTAPPSSASPGGGGAPAGAGLRPTAPREASRSSRSARATASPRVAPIVMQTLCRCGRRRLPRPDSSELRVTAKAARERQRPRRSCDPAPTAHPRGLLLCVGAASAVGCGQGQDKAVALEPPRERGRSVPSHRATRAIPERDAARAGGRRAGAVAELAH